MRKVLKLQKCCASLIPIRHISSHVYVFAYNNNNTLFTNATFSNKIVMEMKEKKGKYNIYLNFCSGLPFPSSSQSENSPCNTFNMSFGLIWFLGTSFGENFNHGPSLEAPFSTLFFVHQAPPVKRTGG